MLTMMCCCSRPKGAKGAPSELNRPSLAVLRRSRSPSPVNVVSAERRMVLDALRADLVNVVMPKIQQATLSEFLEGRMETPVELLYKIDPLVLESCSLCEDNVDCELLPVSEIVLHHLGEPQRGLTVEVADIRATLMPLTFKYRLPHFTSNDEAVGYLTIKVSGLHAFVDATLGVGDQPAAELQKIQVQMANLDITADVAGVSPVAVSSLQDQIQQVAEDGIGQIFRAQLEGTLSGIARQLATSLRTKSSARCDSNPQCAVEKSWQAHGAEEEQQRVMLQAQTAPQEASGVQLVGAEEQVSEELIALPPASPRGIEHPDTMDTIGSSESSPLSQSLTEKAKSCPSSFTMPSNADVDVHARRSGSDLSPNRTAANQARRASTQLTRVERRRSGSITEHTAWTPREVERQKK